MTNAEKYKTSVERHLAYALYCESMRSHDLAILHDQFDWLELEYDIVLRCCPFCGHDAGEGESNGMHYVFCTNCSIKTFDSTTRDVAIAAWNRRAK